MFCLEFLLSVMIFALSFVLCSSFNPSLVISCTIRFRKASFNQAGIYCMLMNSLECY